LQESSAIPGYIEQRFEGGYRFATKRQTKDHCDSVQLLRNRPRIHLGIHDARASSVGFGRFAGQDYIENFYK